MDVQSYLRWSRAECSRELSKFELSFCVHLAHPYSFTFCLFMPTPSLIHFFHIILCVPFFSPCCIIFTCFLSISSSSLSFYPPAILCLFLLYPIVFGYFFTFCSIPWPSPAPTCSPNPLALCLLPSTMSFSIPLYPLLICPPALDLASPGPLPSPSAHLCTLSQSHVLFLPPLSPSISLYVSVGWLNYI